jgi:hypothetical protein
VKDLHLSGYMELHVGVRFLGGNAYNLGIVGTKPKIMVLQLADIGDWRASRTNEHMTMDPGVPSNVRSEPTSMEETARKNRNGAFSKKEK